MQGNLDPSLLLAPWDVIETRLKEILDQGMNRGKHIFNLGHGVFPEVKLRNIKKSERVCSSIYSKIVLLKIWCLPNLT